MKKPPKSCVAILKYLLRARKEGPGWVTTSMILDEVGGTTCVHKRLSELIDLGYAVKTVVLGDERRKLYRANPDIVAWDSLFFNVEAPR